MNTFTVSEETPMNLPKNARMPERLAKRADENSIGYVNRRIESLMANGTALHAAMGTDAPCPKCDAGTGKFCRDSAGRVARHAARVALSTEAKC